ncbi:transcriptional repressor, partial [Bacillus sp. OA1]|nr:transcriptional repressor [Bacillus sp. OA1]
LGEVERKVEHDWSFKVKDHRLTFHGICKNCQENETDEK